MMRYVPGFLLAAAALAITACGGGGGKSSSPWEPDADVLSDEGTAAMVSVPAGAAKVGVRFRVLVRQIKADRNIPRKRKRKTLARTRKMGAFKIDKFEVTNHNYYLFLQTLGPEDREKWRPRHHIEGVKHKYWKGTRYKSGKGNYPVTGIPYEAAVAYAQWRGKRLPDEFEWEYAARGAQGYMFGASSDTYDPARYNVADAWDANPRMVAVNSPRNMRDVSPFGCIGMGGNVSEWCTTKEVREYNILDARTGKPIKGRRQKYRLRAWRGPNFQSAGDVACLLSYQGYMRPKARLLKDRFQFTLGFRCAR